MIGVSVLLVAAASIASAQDVRPLTAEPGISRLLDWIRSRGGEVSDDVSKKQRKPSSSSRSQAGRSISHHTQRQQVRQSLNIIGTDTKSCHR
jgi:hypothetical protein